MLCSSFIVLSVSFSSHVLIFYNILSFFSIISYHYFDYISILSMASQILPCQILFVFASLFLFVYYSMSTHFCFFFKFIFLRFIMSHYLSFITHFPITFTFTIYIHPLWLSYHSLTPLIVHFLFTSLVSHVLPLIILILFLSLWCMSKKSSSPLIDS